MKQFTHRYTKRTLVRLDGTGEGITLDTTIELPEGALICEEDLTEMVWQFEPLDEDYYAWRDCSERTFNRIRAEKIQFTQPRTRIVRRFKHPELMEVVSEWYCHKCESAVSSETVSFEEVHQKCGYAALTVNEYVIRKDQEQREEKLAFPPDIEINESMLCRKCGKPHHLQMQDAGSDQEIDRTCDKCFNPQPEAVKSMEWKEPYTKMFGLLTNIRFELTDHLPEDYIEWIDKVINESDEIIAILSEQEKNQFKK